MSKGNDMRDSSGHGVVCAVVLRLLTVLALMLTSSAADARADCFCTDKVGNVNADSLDQVSLGDVAVLIDHLFISGVELPCSERANVDGDTAGVVDLADVTLLIEHLFISYEPLPDCPPPKDYVMYFMGMSYEGWFYAYHPVTNELDSFFIAGTGRLRVSADGRYGYRSLGPAWASLVSLDSIQNGDTVQPIINLPVGTVNVVSPDGLTIATDMIDGLHIFRTSDYSELYRDSTLQPRVYSQNGKRLYGVTRNTYHAFQLNLSDSAYTFTTKEFEGYLVGDIVPSPDETKWYLLFASATSYLRGFAVYDVAADSLSFKEFPWPGGSPLAVSPTGQHVFYTNAGDILWGPGDYDLRVYDTKSDSLSRISLYGIFAELEDTGALVDNVCVTPDGRWLVMLCGNYPFAVITMDLADMQLKHYRFGSQSQGGLTCQRAR